MKCLPWLLAGALLLTACAAPAGMPVTQVSPQPSTAVTSPRAAPTLAPSLTASPRPSATASPTSSPTRTPRPSATPSSTPISSATPSATAVPPTRVPATLAPPTATIAPTPDFVGVALAVRANMDNYIWQLDQAAWRRGGYFAWTHGLVLKGETQDLNCVELTRSYDYVRAQPALSLPAEWAGIHDLYSRGVSLFVAEGLGVFQACLDFQADPETDRHLSQNIWVTALNHALTARSLLTEAIIAAGGTP